MDIGLSEFKIEKVFVLDKPKAVLRKYENIKLTALTIDLTIY